MADQRLTDKGAISSIDDSDLLHIVDVSDTSSDPAGTSKKGLWSLIKSTLKTYFDTLYATESLNEQVLGFAFSGEDEVLSAGAGRITFATPNFAITLTGVSVNLVDSPLGSASVFDLNLEGTSVLSTKISVDSGDTNSEDSATPPVISTSAIPANSIMEVDIDSVGITEAGTGGKMWIYYERA